jgi:sulfur carrier protein
MTAHALDDALTVSALLQQLDQLKPGAALALNQQILPRERWEEHIVQDGDQILLFRLSQGLRCYALQINNLIHICLPVPGNLPTQR